MVQVKEWEGGVKGVCLEGKLDAEPGQVSEALMLATGLLFMVGADCDLAEVVNRLP